jgi:hypothetical protein
LDYFENVLREIGPPSGALRWSNSSARHRDEALSGPFEPTFQFAWLDRCHINAASTLLIHEQDNTNQMQGAPAKVEFLGTYILAFGLTHCRETDLDEISHVRRVM